RFIHRSQLDNGLDMIVVENHAVPLTTLLVAVRNGAFTQDSAEQGLAHLYEHLLFRSYHGRPDAFGIEVTKLNGTYNGATDAEVVYYYIMVPAKNVERALKLLAGITIDRLKEAYARYYVPNNAALIVTGDVSSDQVFERAAKEFGDWKRGPDPFADRPVPPVTPRPASGAIVFEHDVRDVTIRIALPGPGVGRA